MSGESIELFGAGLYAQVTFSLKNEANSVTIPGGAILYRGNAPAVAVVDADNIVRLKPVSIGKDQGKLVEIVAGLNTGDGSADNPTDALRTGDKVRVQQPRPNTPKQAACGTKMRGSSRVHRSSVSSRPIEASAAQSSSSALR